MNSDWVTLNIGGCRYETTKETLLSRGKCFFTGLLSGKTPSDTDENGAFKIDRNGSVFEPILLYLRTGFFEYPEGISREAFWREVDFYQIDIPRDLVFLDGTPAIRYEYFIIYLDKEFMWKDKTEGFCVSYPSSLVEHFRTYCKDGFVTYSELANLTTLLSDLGFSETGNNEKLWIFRRAPKTN